MKIVLLRHGRPEYDLENLKHHRVAPAEIPGVISRYISSPLNEDHLPPEASIELATSCHTVVCSHLLRSTDSARLLGINTIHHIDPLFREADLPHSTWRYPRMSLYSWFITFRLLWLLGYQNNGESFRQSRQRARQGANKLISLAHENDSVIFVGHGLLNRLMARCLLAEGWLGPKSPGQQYWDTAVYRYD